MKSFLDFWHRCFDFTGTTSRRDFRKSLIWFFIVTGLVEILDMIVLSRVFGIPVSERKAGLVLTVYCIFGITALISMSVRRVRDTGCGGKNVWKFLIPIIGYARLLWCLFFEESAQDNQS